MPLPRSKGGGMQEKNALAMKYLDNKVRIADLINVMYFRGEIVVRPSDIHDVDGVQYRVKKPTGKVEAQQLARDKIRKVILGMQCVFIGIEHQSDINYIMPLRVMGYDLAEYERQVRELKSEHRRKMDLAGSEYISGIASTDRLYPVVTCVLYLGDKPWTGPRDLHDMLSLSGKLASFRKYIPHYPIQIIEAGISPDWRRFSTDLRELFGFLQHRKNGMQMKQYLEEHSREFGDLSEDLYDLLGSIGSKNDLQKLKEKNRTERGGINMCRAWQEWKEMEREEGRKQGIEQGIEQGEDRINCLYTYLLRDERMEDMQKAMADRAYRRQLCQEYCLIL